MTEEATTEEKTLAPGEHSIEVNSPKTDRSVAFVRNFGATIEESVEMFGAEVVHSVFTAQAIIRAQGAARTVLDKGENGGEQAVEAGLAYTPGVVRRSAGGGKKDPFNVLAEKMKSGTLTEEQLLEELKKRMAL